MATKKYDVAVKTGTYTKDGQEKSRFENVGAVWSGDNGHYLVMKRTFNPAGVPFKEGSDSIFLSLFEPRDDQQQGQGQGQQRGQQQTRPQQQSRDSFQDSDVPF
jgi:peptide methionine sulfoxide reductase MsrA